MARPTKYWYDLMMAEKATMPSLNALEPNIDNSQQLTSDLRSTSKVGRWRLLFWCIAACASALDTVFDRAIAIITSLIKNSRYGTLPWYSETAKSFQYGDSLVLVNQQWQYATIDITKQIVTLAASEEGGNGAVNLKVARSGPSFPQQLTAPQLSAFTAYINKVKPAGIRVNIINDNPDELRLFLAINFDPLLLSATGELITSPGQYPVETAVNAYLKRLTTESGFNGSIELMSLIDYIESSAQGVVSAYVNSASGRYGANPFAPFTQRYSPNAGYCIIDPLNPLSTTITYTANV